MQQQSTYEHYMLDLQRTATIQMENLRLYISRADIEENFQPIYDQLLSAKDYREAMEHFSELSKQLRDCGLADVVNKSVIDLRNESFNRGE